MIELDADQLLENAIRDGLRGCIKDKLSGYNSPLDKMLSAAFEKHKEALHTLLTESIASCVHDAHFRGDIAQAVRHSLAKTLVQRFGGEMEKQVNVLKSDPTTRARITLAIEEIVRSKAS
jgi:hypothetical protein